jgi:hypothetical protein
MIAQAGAAGARWFVGVDGQRSLLALAALPAVALASLNPYFIHDAFVSAQHLYAEAELAQIAGRAAPGAAVKVRADFPLMTVLTVDFTRSSGGSP